MKEHFTSWSSISKSLNGRTENSIKNYFYSTIRRIQSCKVIEYLDLMKQQKELPAIESSDKFQVVYQLDTLNKLGVIICKWLFKNEQAKKEHQALFDYLLNVLADEKKRPKPKPQRIDEPFENLPTDNPNPEQGYSIQNLFPELFSGKNCQGVHPLLPLALYGGFGRLKSRDFFQSVIQEPPQASSFNPTLPAQQSKFNLDNASDISVPIPQVKYSLKENQDPFIPGDLPNRMSEVLNGRLQHSLFSLLLANLQKSIPAPSPSHRPMPSGNWNSSSDQSKDGAAGSRDSGSVKAASPPFRATQQLRQVGFSPVNLGSAESRPASFSQALQNQAGLDHMLTSNSALDPQGLADVRKSTENILKCSKCLLTSQVCRCLL